MAPLLLGGSWGQVGSFFAFFSHFLVLFRHHCFSCRFFLIFHNCSWIFDGFLLDFGRIFRGFFAFSLKAPIAKIHAPTQCFVRVKLLKIQQKVRKNRHKIDAIFRCEKKTPNLLKKWIWEGLGLRLGRVWDGLGRLWGALKRFLVAFLVF